MEIVSAMLLEALRIISHFFWKVKGLSIIYFGRGVRAKNYNPTQRVCGLEEVFGEIRTKIVQSCLQVQARPT
jgi:hypothetical protein